MAKKKKGSKPAGGSGAVPLGELREIPKLVKRFKAGDMHGADGLMSLGRDAAFSVLALGEETGDEALIAFGKKLVAVPPRDPTNMIELRKASVQALLAAAKKGAPQAQDLAALAVHGSAALFDPQRVADDLAKSGHPRRNQKRMLAGDIAWFGLPVPEANLSLSLEPFDAEGVPVVRLRLKVDSGVIFVGPPEASDGARLGTLKLDPFHTQLDQGLVKGMLVRLKPGAYQVLAYMASRRAVRVHLLPETNPKAPLDLVQATARGLVAPEVWG